LAIAYLEPEKGHVTARALCWPARKIFGRVYGDDGKLIPMLESAGFSAIDRHSKTSFNGAKLLRTEDDYGFVCPYLDSPNYGVEDDGEFLRIGGDIDARNTNGLTEDTRARCHNCDDRFDREDCGYTDDNGSCRAIRCGARPFRLMVQTASRSSHKWPTSSHSVGPC
jgi:hypothetical protein